MKSKLCAAYNIGCYGNYELVFLVRVQFDYKNGYDQILIMVCLVAATTVTLESSDSGASSVEDSAMDTDRYPAHLCIV